MACRQFNVFREFTLTLLSVQQFLFACTAIWGGILFFLTFHLKDLPLIGLLIIGIGAYSIGQLEHLPATDALILLFGFTLGRAVRYFLYCGSRRESAQIGKTETDQSGAVSAAAFVFGSIGLLTIVSWWHLDMTNNFYHGPRWMGLWNNPNDYGMLMGVGVTLAIGLLAQNLKSENLKAEIKDRKAGSGMRKAEIFWKSAIGNWKLAILFVAAGMMGVGLAMSYSRGAWIATAIGLLYLAKPYGKIKWRSLLLFLLSGFCFLFLLACLFWNTPRTAPWYFQRLDLSRGSVQHRLAAWKAGFEMMRDHPFGVGWNKTVETYERNYSPQEGSASASAIVTNDYLMLGTQLGIPALICFVAYVALSLKSGKWKAESGILPSAAWRVRTAEGGISAGEAFAIHNSQFGIRVACRAGALVCLVAFWFDGGLFKLATASVFWILLELGAETRFKPQMNTDEHRFGDAKERLKPAASADSTDSADPNQKSASIREIRGLTAPVTRRTSSVLWTPSPHPNAEKGSLVAAFAVPFVIRVYLCPSVAKGLGYGAAVSRPFAAIRMQSGS
ncbi:MAG TPA: O-antigen ligase family protein [Verrucomicrobiae bacterium]|nr:O-antigen ligase family protein [Verrucomicrobiae bacterium]